MGSEKDFERHLELIERGVREIEASADAGLRATAQGLVQSVLELHARSLERLLEIVHGFGEPGQAIIDQLGRDALVNKLLLLHALHPLTLEARVLQALDEMRPSLQSQRAEVEVVSLVDGVVRLRIHGPHGLRSSVERAILDAAPDITRLDVEETAQPVQVVGFVSLASLRGPESRRADPKCVPIAAPTQGL